VNLIGTANVHSDGLSEEICGQVLEGRRDQVLVATRARMPMGEGPNDIVETLAAVAADRGASPAQVALAWLLARLEKVSRPGP
jgi:aryl-alcohol dehydrogenase-like predicted oxidoreductase